MKLRKFLAAVCSAVMAFTLIPSIPAASSVAYAAPSTQAEESGLVLDKTASIEDDGTYTINLEAYATGVTTSTVVTKEVPLDIVLVLDQSGSMKYDFNGDTTSTNKNRRQYAMKNAVNKFIDTVAAKYSAEADHRISIVTFGSDASNLQGWTDVNASGQSTLKNEINRLPDQPSGSTNVADGMTNAQSLVNAGYTGANPDRKKVVIVFTDGVPTTSSAFDTTVATNSIKTAKAMKDAGVTVYTVGIFNGANPNQTYGDSGFDKNSNGTVGSKWYDDKWFSISDIRSVDIPAGNRFLNYVSSNYANATEIGLKYSNFNIGIYNRATFEITNNFNRTNNSYYLIASDAAGLNNVFESISSTITSGSTSVTLDSTAVMRDILSDDFVLPAGYNAASSITVKTVKGTAASNGAITWGDQTSTANNVTATANVETGMIDVTGFDYSDKFITAAHPGEKLIVTIKGVVPAADYTSGDAVKTNSPDSGIYGSADGEIAATPTERFPLPTTALYGKAYVIDYAKPTELADAGNTIKGIHAAPAKNTGVETSVAGTYGSAALSGEKVVYTPSTMSWNGYDNFFTFGKKVANCWTKVSVVPANNVYYEDSFVSTNGIAGIEYSGSWNVIGSESGNTEVANDGVQGWTESLADDQGDSDGSVHEATSAKGNLAKASFTFSGTGVDVYGRTSAATGSIKIKVAGPETKTLYINTDSQSGDYYSIPTASVMDLPYGDYTVTITVLANSDKLKYYIDGIRIYNPVEVDDVVADAYGEDELKAAFTMVRDSINNGTVFIDKTEAGEIGAEVDYNATEYGTYGPANEVYLASGQSVTFKVQNGGAYYVGMKAIDGAATAVVTNDDARSNVSINSTVDQYYKVSPSSDGMITVMNNGSGILSLTKVKACGTAAGVMTLAEEPDMSNLAASYVSRFATMALVDYEEPVSDPVIDTPADNNTDDVVIENPVEEEAPVETEQPAKSDSFLQKLVKGFGKIFGR